MRVNECVGCERFPCADVRRESHIIPDIDVAPEKVSIVLISEAAPENVGDYYYASGNPLFAQTTIQAFNDAGVQATTIQDIVDQGVYLTSAIKCGKTGYGIATATVNECSLILN